jgi:electron transfer flavoprotein alpha subunit
MNTWVYIDHFKKAAPSVSWEAIGVGKTLGKVSALLIGSDIDGLAKSAIEYGADEIFLADDPSLKDYQADVYATTISQAAKSKNPDLFIFPNTIRGRQLAAMVAIDLNTGVLVDIIAPPEEIDGRLVITRPIYGGKILTREICLAKPPVITIRNHVFPCPLIQTGRPDIRTKIVAAKSERPVVVEDYTTPNDNISLTNAKVIVAGGRGVAKNPWQGFRLIEELAGVVGGATGATRGAVDEGYAPYESQIGQSGKIVSPDLYIACGIRGSVQHLAGIRSSKIIVAVNNNSNAPIFDEAHYGLVGDLFQILPALISEFEQRCRNGQK